LFIQVGPKKAREMWFLTRFYDAVEAEKMGLINTVVPVSSFRLNNLTLILISPFAESIPKSHVTVLVLHYRIPIGKVIKLSRNSYGIGSYLKQ